MSQPDLRVALVTGAARGIGAATVFRLLDTGHAVIAVDSCAGSSAPAGVTYPLARPSDLDRVTSTAPERVLAIHCDVRDRGGMSQAVERGMSRFGRLDAVVAAAGVMIGGALAWETPA